MGLDFEGRRVPIEDGDTVASALYRAGVRTFTRSLKSHRRRGLYCITGDCPNCLVTVDGLPGERACITEAREACAWSARRDGPRPIATCSRCTDRAAPADAGRLLLRRRSSGRGSPGSWPRRSSAARPASGRCRRPRALARSRRAHVHAGRARRRRRGRRAQPPRSRPPSAAGVRSSADEGRRRARRWRPAPIEGSSRPSRGEARAAERRRSSSATPRSGSTRGRSCRSSAEDELAAGPPDADRGRDGRRRDPRGVPRERPAGRLARAGRRAHGRRARRAPGRPRGGRSTGTGEGSSTLYGAAARSGVAPAVRRLATLVERTTAIRGGATGTSGQVTCGDRRRRPSGTRSASSATRWCSRSGGAAGRAPSDGPGSRGHRRRRRGAPGLLRSRKRRERAARRAGEPRQTASRGRSSRRPALGDRRLRLPLRGRHRPRPRDGLGRGLALLRDPQALHDRHDGTLPGGAVRPTPRLLRRTKGAAAAGRRADDRAAARRAPAPGRT